jgi:hypothetical protein
MQFEQRDVGPYRLYAGAREVTGQCFEGMIVVVQSTASGAKREVYRTQRFPGSRLFGSAEAALTAAFREGGNAVRAQA